MFALGYSSPILPLTAAGLEHATSAGIQTSFRICHRCQNATAGGTTQLP